jgi:predicted  nucleic acid-binding Zn-ribbon protein
MSELDTEARSAGNAAIAALRKALVDAETRLEWFSEEFIQAKEQLGRAQVDVLQLEEAIAELRRKEVNQTGGDGHEG